MGDRRQKDQIAHIIKTTYLLLKYIVKHFRNRKVAKVNFRGLWSGFSLDLYFKFCNQVL